VSVVALTTLIVVEMRRREPVVDPRFFRSAPFSGSVLTAICATGSLAGFLFLSTLYLQEVRGMSALMAGLHLLPMAVVMATGAVLSGRLLARRGPRVPMLIAGLGLVVGALLLSRLSTSSGTLFVLVAFAVLGIGSGLVNAPITQAAVSGMPVSQAGVASGIASTSRQVGQSLGVAIVGSILAASLHGPLRTGFISASHAAWFVLAGCGVVVFVLGLITTGRWAQGTVERTAELFSPVIPPGDDRGATGAGPRASQPATSRRARVRPDPQNASKPSSPTPSP
jgi:predicted MFS family arabinose efflux permease